MVELARVEESQQGLAGPAAEGSWGAGAGLSRKRCWTCPPPGGWWSGSDGTYVCGWEAAGGVPSEATFSRAFAEFGLPGRLHEALLDRTLEGHLAGHV